MGFFDTLKSNFKVSSGKKYKCRKCGRMKETMFNPTEVGDQKCNSRGKCTWVRVN